LPRSVAGGAWPRLEITITAAVAAAATPTAVQNHHRLKSGAWGWVCIWDWGRRSSADEGEAPTADAAVSPEGGSIAAGAGEAPPVDAGSPGAVALAEVCAQPCFGPVAKPAETSNSATILATVGRHQSGWGRVSLILIMGLTYLASRGRVNLAIRLLRRCVARPPFRRYGKSGPGNRFGSHFGSRFGSRFGNRFGNRFGSRLAGSFRCLARRWLEVFDGKQR